MKIKWKFWQQEQPQPEDNYMFSGVAPTVVFDGEKTPYELGRPQNIVLDYYALRIRSWEAYIKSDIIQNAIRKYVLWIVGSGLKIQADPITDILPGVSLPNTFMQNIEHMFRLYCNSKNSTYSKNLNLHKQAAEALKNAILSGDVLIVQRFKNKNLSVDVIDGVFVQTPISTDYIEQAEKKGNYIDSGVEINSTGEHVAFYVLQYDNSYARILSKGEKTGRHQAWLMYGLRHKLNEPRGTSLLTAVLETAAKMDRYKDATLGQAEENGKVPYTFEHDQFSDGTNPMGKQFVQSLGKGKPVAPETAAATCDSYATKIAQTTGKTAYNLPPGAHLKHNTYTVDPQFEPFFNINSDIVYATIGIPPEVALDKFGGAYSSSRAALKSWEYKMMVDRVNIMSEEYYKPIYQYWFDMQALMNKINAPGYLELMMGKDYILQDAYLNCRFIGRGVPHIDPLKEVNAVRKKIGDKFNSVPLMTMDQGAEELNTGDFSTIIKKAKNEKDHSSDFIDSDVDADESRSDSVS